MLTIVSLQVKPKPDMSDYLLSTFPQEMPERMHLAPVESQPPSRPQSTRPRPGTVGLSDVVGRASTAPSAAALPQPTAAAAAAQSNVGSTFGAGQTAADRQALQQALDMLPPTPSMQLLARSKHARPGSVMMQKDGLIKPGYVAWLLVASPVVVAYCLCIFGSRKRRPSVDSAPDLDMGAPNDLLDPLDKLIMSPMGSELYVMRVRVLRGTLYLTHSVLAPSYARTGKFDMLQARLPTRMRQRNKERLMSSLKELRRPSSQGALTGRRASTVQVDEARKVRGGV